MSCSLDVSCLARQSQIRPVQESKRKHLSLTNEDSSIFFVLSSLLLLLNLEAVQLGAGDSEGAGEGEGEG